MFRIAAGGDKIPCTAVVESSWSRKDEVHEGGEGGDNGEEEEHRGAFRHVAWVASWGDDCGDGDGNSCSLLVHCRVAPMVLLDSGIRR